ncbi:MAG: YaiI/YqxD family protein [Acidobacteriota bacterium]
MLVDADACPRAVREVLERAAMRGRIELVLVANRPLRTARAAGVRAVRADDGFDAADRLIVEQAGPGDLAITSDVPLAAELAGRGVTVLTPRGEEITEDNAGERLASRNLAESLRAGGEPTGGPAPFGARDRRAFADALDRALTRLGRRAHGAV